MCKKNGRSIAVLLGRTILMVAILFLSSCQQPKTRAITIFETGYEILNGKVRELTEITSYNSKREIALTSFDQSGNAIKTWKTSIWKEPYTLQYKYLYNKRGKRAEVIMSAGDSEQPYKCDTNGHIAEERFNIKDYDFDKEDFAKRKEVFKYDSRGDLSECDSYFDTNRFTITTYKYNSRHFRIETDEFGETKILQIKVLYNYPIVDKNDNWLKRTAILTRRVKENGHLKLSIEKDTVERWIVYY